MRPKSRPVLAGTVRYGLIIICFIKDGQEILLDPTDLILQEQPEDNLMVVISWA